MEEDEYGGIQAREGRLRRVGDGFRPAPEPRILLNDDLLWDTLSSWAPPDDTDYALDASTELFDTLLAAEVMEETLEAPKPAKKNRSKVSVSLHYLSILSLLMRWSRNARMSCGWISIGRPISTK